MAVEEGESRQPATQSVSDTSGGQRTEMQGGGDKSSRHQALPSHHDRLSIHDDDRTRTLVLRAATDAAQRILPPLDTSQRIPLVHTVALSAMRMDLTQIHCIQRASIRLRHLHLVHSDGRIHEPLKGTNRANLTHSLAHTTRRR